MVKLKHTLGFVLLAQLVLAAIFYWGNTETAVKSKPLFQNSGNFDKMIISGRDQSTTLQRRRGRWTIEQLGELPADDQRVTEALEKITETTLTFPLTQSANSHDRFEVAEDNFQRRIEFIAESETQGSLFLGTSPGFRQVHLRRGSEDEVYSVALNTYDYSADPQQWLDKKLLAIESPEKIRGTDYNLSRQGSEWTLGSGEAVDQNAAQKLVSALAELNIIKIAEPLSGELLEEKEVEVFRGKERTTYKLQSDDEEYRISRSDMDKTFSLTQFEFKKIADVALSDLVLAIEGSDSENEQASADAQN